MTRDQPLHKPVLELKKIKCRFCRRKNASGWYQTKPTCKVCFKIKQHPIRGFKSRIKRKEPIK